MRRQYLTIAIACIFCLLILGASGYRNYKTHNEVINKNYEHKGKGRYKVKQPAEKPWLLLPNHNQCFQNWCDRNEDCCRGYNICDLSAKVCIDCWYGYHCRSSANCCENFPICEKKYNEEYGRCINPNY
ncbi:hypothetical protein LSH36_49g00046 [Paralvinella palmiformis]|uniref:Uncharacterized protein n=1 Tax=Paralvinella palmiformis TaxID=53620 RepID=A0AAD9K6D2_9ANNE|nr:hypothetical protein LSH36_49g00046 [Paralvinella palmiformis]